MYTCSTSSINLFSFVICSFLFKAVFKFFSFDHTSLKLKMNASYIQIRACQIIA